MKLFLTLFSMFAITTLNAQKLKVKNINKNFIRVDDKINDFDYLNEEMDSSTYVWIADMRVSFGTLQPTTIFKAYSAIKERANILGANAFSVTNSDIYAERGELFIEVSVYWLHREHREKNLSLYDRENIYFFGFLAHHEDIPGYTVVIDEDEKILLKELTYIKRPIQLEDTMRVELKKGMKSNELTFVHKIKSPWNYIYFYLHKGAFNVGEIRNYETEVGEFLKRILNEV
jgi:hypothetical protein